MGPALVEPDHLSRWVADPDHVEPQWGRLSSSRITLPAPGSGVRRPSRNGAGSRRAGSPAPHAAALIRAVAPQWGRLSSSRITGAAFGRHGEPDHGRNGAGSRRAGSPDGDHMRGAHLNAAMGPALV